MAARTKACVCGQSPAGIVGSNPAEGMDVCLFWLLYFFSGRSVCLGVITRLEESIRCDRETPQREAISRKIVDWLEGENV